MLVECGKVCLWGDLGGKVCLWGALGGVVRCGEMCSCGNGMW